MDANGNVSVLSNGKSTCDKKERLWKVMFAVGLLLMVACMSIITAHASTLPDDIAGSAKSVYADIRTIATPIAAVSFVIALVISFLSHNQRAVDASRQTAKGILITWLIIMIAGAIFAYGNDIVKNFSGAGDMPTTTIEKVDDSTKPKN